MEIKDRIKEVRLQANNGDKMMQTEFAERIGLKMSTVSQIERGKLKPTAQTIELICRAFDINKDWLETGKGQMKKEKPPLDEVAMLVSEILDEGEDDPFYQFVLNILRVYQRLTPSRKELFRNFVQETINAQNDDHTTDKAK